MRYLFSVPGKRPEGNGMFKQYYWGKLDEDDIYKGRGRVKGCQRANTGSLRLRSLETVLSKHRGYCDQNQTKSAQ